MDPTQHVLTPLFSLLNERSGVYRVPLFGTGIELPAASVRLTNKGYFMMKFIFAVSILAATAASADSVKLPRGAVGLSTIEDIVAKRVVVPQPPASRPGGPVVEILSLLEVVLPLGGCLDQLGPVTYTSHNNGDGKTTILLSATRIEMKGSQLARCNRQPTAAIRIPLGLGFANADNYEVEMLTAGVYKDLAQ
jgi:hypothetical protein